MQRNYTVVGLILITFFVISFLTNILGALNPSASASFDLTETMAGFLPFSFFIAYGVMSIPAGFLLEKFGEKRMMISGFILAFMGSLLFALFPTFWLFVISLFVIGAGMAILQVVINPLLRIAGGEEHYAFNSVLAQLMFGLASFISPLVYSFLVVNMAGSEVSSNLNFLNSIVNDEMTWTIMYWLFSGISIIMIIVVFLTPMPRISLKEEEKVGSAKTYLKLFRSRTIILYFFGIFSYVGIEQGISYWMSKFLQIYHGLDYETTGAVAVGRFWGLMTIGGIAGLFLLKLLDSKLVLKIFSILAIICLASGLFGTTQISFYGFQASGFFLAVMFPIIISLGLNSLKEHHGSAAGIFMSGIMGGAIFQILIGFLGDTFSLKTGMMFNFLGLAYILSIGFWAKPLINNKTLNKK
ncbi:MFS transporter [Gramella jeungdoensis]|uniref:MFS transporter n=1 Tax=Gramella jeungdoensis TaxID=708091 RepID=A0ABT0Z5W5_9FLAO|nr:MFS transporter [Gramella jeungdoensis]MCM8571115.1 MFS transporter [Gramella jeungdoensis]